MKHVKVVLFESRWFWDPDGAFHLLFGSGGAFVGASGHVLLANAQAWQVILEIRITY